MKMYYNKHYTNIDNIDLQCIEYLFELFWTSQIVHCLDNL